MKPICSLLLIHATHTAAIDPAADVAEAQLVFGGSGFGLPPTRRWADWSMKIPLDRGAGTDEIGALRGSGQRAAASVAAAGPIHHM